MFPKTTFLCLSKPQPYYIHINTFRYKRSKNKLNNIYFVLDLVDPKS